MPESEERIFFSLAAIRLRQQEDSEDLNNPSSHGKSEKSFLRLESTKSSHMETSGGDSASDQIDIYERKIINVHQLHHLELFDRRFHSKSRTEEQVLRGFERRHLLKGRYSIYY